MSWATYRCRCGDARFQHGDPLFAGPCRTCDCTAFTNPPPLPVPPEPPREPEPEPHPSCPTQEPGCNGMHPTIGW
jgi:hypothetical protein